MNEEWFAAFNDLLTEYGECFVEENFLAMYKVRGKLLEHIELMEPNRVPSIVASAYRAWIAAPSTNINGLSPELKSLTNLVGVNTPRES